MKAVNTKRIVIGKVIADCSIIIIISAFVTSLKSVPRFLYVQVNHSEIK